MKVLRSARWLLLVLLLPLIPASQARAGVFISVGFAPPILPVYVQPPCPEPGYMWTPGYWGYGPDGYYWVPGHVGGRALLWRALDTALLGLARWPLCFPLAVTGVRTWAIMAE